MRRDALSMAASAGAGSGPDVKEVLADMEILDVVVIGELAEELELRSIAPSLRLPPTSNANRAALCAALLLGPAQ